MENNPVIKVLQKIFPGSAIHEGSGGSDALSYFVIPGKDGPRWIVPKNWREGQAFLKEWTPYDPASRLKWGLVMAAYRAGLLAVVPGIKTFHVSRGNHSWKQFGWTLPDPPSPVIYIGTPALTRKAVAGLVNRRTGELASIAKIPLEPGASKAIRHEHDILGKLVKLKPGIAPKPLHMDKKSGIAVQEALHGKPLGRALTAGHIQWLLDLRVGSKSISLKEISRSLDEKILKLNPDKKTRTVIDRVLLKIDDPASLPAVWTHGDFAPWNLKKCADQKLKAVDWEFSEPCGLPLFDLVYFQTIQMSPSGGKKLFPKNLRMLLQTYLDALDIPEALVEKLILACLLQDWMRAYGQGYFGRAELLFTLIKERLGGGE